MYLVCQVSRGLAPVSAIVRTMGFAHARCWPYTAITERPLVEAKVLAQEAALDQELGLLLVEDDILSTWGIWSRAAGLKSHQVGYAHCRMRNGVKNVVYDRHGNFIYTGNVFTAIPWSVLQALPMPAFAAMKFAVNFKEGIMEPRGPRDDGSGSDQHLWWCLSKLVEVQLVELGPVRHLRHELNEKVDRATPSVISEW